MINLLLGIIYLSFISLGLPDGLLGAAWPTMCLEMDVPVSFAGWISVTISLGTIASSLLSDRLTLRFSHGEREYGFESIDPADEKQEEEKKSVKDAAMAVAALGAAAALVAIGVAVKVFFSDRDEK